MPQNILQRNIKLLSWFNFCLDFRIYGAITVLYFSQVTGSYTLGLGIFSIATISTSLFEVPTGIFSDLIGRKMTILFGQIAKVFAIFCYAIGGSFFLLAVGAVLEGLSLALFSGNNTAFLYDSLKEKNLEGEFGHFQGKTSSMFQFALASGALIGAFVLGWWSFKILFWLSIIPQIIGLLLVFGFTEPKRHYQNIKTNIFHHTKEALQKFKQNAKLRKLSLATIIDNGVGESMHQFSPVFLATLWPVWAISIARVIAHLTAALGFRAGGKLIKKFGEFRVLLCGNTSTFIIGTTITAYPTMITPLINAFTSFGFGTGIVAQQNLLQKEFSDKERATMSSLNSLAGSLLFSIAAFFLGMLADTIGPQWTLLTARIFILPSYYFYWKTYRYTP